MSNNSLIVYYSIDFDNTWYCCRVEFKNKKYNCTYSSEAKEEMFKSFLEKIPELFNKTEKSFLTIYDFFTYFCENPLFGWLFSYRLGKGFEIFYDGEVLEKVYLTFSVNGLDAVTDENKFIESSFPLKRNEDCYRFRFPNGGTIPHVENRKEVKQILGKSLQLWTISLIEFLKIHQFFVKDLIVEFVFDVKDTHNSENKSKNKHKGGLGKKRSEEVNNF